MFCSLSHEQVSVFRSTNLLGLPIKLQKSKIKGDVYEWLESSGRPQEFMRRQARYFDSLTVCHLADAFASCAAILDKKGVLIRAVLAIVPCYSVFELWRGG